MRSEDGEEIDAGRLRRLLRQLPLGASIIMCGEGSNRIGIKYEGSVVARIDIAEEKIVLGVLREDSDLPLKLWRRNGKRR